MALYSPRKSIISEFQRCHWHRWNGFSGVNDTLKSRWWQSEKFYRDMNYRIFFAEFQQCQWHRWNDFRGVNDTAETISAVSMTPLKLMWHRWNLKQTLQVLVLHLKGKSRQNISMANIPMLYIIQVLEAEKSWGLPRPHFRLQRCQWHHWNRFWRLSKRLSRRIRWRMQNGFSLLIRDIWGWLMKKPESRKSRATVPLSQIF
jgi:hypothetical protein